MEIKSETQFLTGWFLTNAAGEVTNGIQQGVISGFYHLGVDALKTDENNSNISGIPHIYLPEITVEPPKENRLRPHDQDRLNKHLNDYFKNNKDNK